MSRSSLARALGLAPDPITVTGPSGGNVIQTTTISTYGADKSAFLQKAQAAHAAAVADHQRLNAALNQMASVWSPLPLGPYPPAGDTSGWPRTGDPKLVISQSGISQAQRDEPGKIVNNLALRRQALRPKITPLFWVGLACLGAGYLVLRRE